ncbi:helix-turn-helix domain-containing protein [Thiocystis violacea]|uniref:helix-turn-helix domain-containing protein n=1 Tax=Thiocystis violacea TaxID=13725 RepID=UPI001903A165|nr:helix-turn-helix domain-containing protein [Thiocystis violacea]MBK1716356.1 hypothetical protein [Thiocystis violacea]
MLLTLNEAGESLRVSGRTVRRLIASGQIRSTRVGGSVRVSRVELERLIASGTEIVDTHAGAAACETGDGACQSESKKSSRIETGSTSG